MPDNLQEAKWNIQQSEVVDTADAPRLIARAQAYAIIALVEELQMLNANLESVTGRFPLDNKGYIRVEKWEGAE